MSEWQQTKPLADSAFIEKVILENPKLVEDYKNGDLSSLKQLTGLIMQAVGGKANPLVVIEILKKRLET